MLNVKPEDKAKAGAAEPPAPKSWGSDPLDLLLRSIEAVPQMKWALAAVGLFAAVVIIQALVRSPVFGLAGAAGVLVVMVVLFVFSRVVQMAARASRTAAVVFMWFAVVVGMATIGCVFWSAFFNEPWPLREKLFASEVSRRAEAAGLPKAATAAKELSEAALVKLVQLGDSHHMVGSIDRHTGEYVLSPIPESVRELDKHGLIEWRVPPEEFAVLTRRLGISDDIKEPRRITLPPDLPTADRELLLDYSYHLNPPGKALYDLMVSTVIRQIKEV